MDGNNTKTVCCCFCGQPLRYADSVQLVASTEGMGDEQQKLFAHKKCLAERLHPSVPLHPDLSNQ
jgi:hypothetical protein